jgi:hypothetical protein
VWTTDQRGGAKGDQAEEGEEESEHVLTSNEERTAYVTL